MYSVSSGFVSSIKEASREFKSKVLVGENEYSDDKIINFTVEKSMAPSDEFSLGAVVASKFELTIALADIRNSKVIKPYIALKIGKDFEYVPLGVFNIEEKSIQNGVVNIKCFDNVGKFEKPYFSDLSYPTTIQRVASEICGKAGVTLATTLPTLNIDKKIDGYTCREALSFIASACGGFAIANRTGAIEIKSGGSSTSSITGDNYFTFENDDAFTIKKVTAHVDENTVISRGEGIGIEEVEFKNPIANNQIMDHIYSKLKNYTYIPASLVWQGNPALDVGEKMSVTDISGTKKEMLVMRDKITYSGGLRGEINSVAKSLGKSNFNYGGSMQGAVDRVTAEQIVVKELLADKADISELNAINANIESLTVSKADIEQLKATNANIENLKANKANISDLNATNATISNLQATKADIVDLTATNAKIGILEAEVGKIGVLEGDVANIQDIIGGNISSDNIQSGGITGDRLNMNTIFVNDANIVNVNASKVNAGEIDTSKVKIKSADGTIEIAGATQQFRDKNNKVRIQMGKDAKGDFNFIIKGEDGTTTLIDHTGVKESAIADDLIQDNMIAEDAVGEKQIDYDSFSTGFNKDTNTTQIKATKVKLDNQGQTLDVAFTSLKNQADGTKTQTESNTTQLNIANGKIETAIANTKIVKNGKEILLKDDYNTTVATVDSMKNTISSHTTKIDANTGKIGSVESKTNILERDLNSMSSKISATETTVNTHTTEISTVNANASNAQNTANTAVGKADKAQTDANKNKADIITVNTEVTTTKNKVSGIEQDLNSVTTRVGSVESTTTSHTATINSHTSSLNAVDGKINTAKTDAINTAKSDATIKANDAKNQAISSAATDAQNKSNKALSDAKSYTGVEITKVNSTMSSKFAEIKTTTDSITQSVTATNKEVETVKVNVTNAQNTANSANSKINGLEIGGRNLARETDVYITTGSKTGIVLDVETIKKQAGKQITVSIDVEIVNGVSSTNNGRVGMEFSVQFTDGSINYFGVWEAVGTSTKNVKKRITSTIHVTANKTISIVNALGIYIQRTTSGTFKIGRPKVELGDKNTDWTAAPEDISKEILEVTTEKVNTAKAEIKVTTDSISNRVGEVETKSIKNAKVGSFRYIRDWLNGSTANTGNHWCELEVWVNETNIARGKAISGSSGLTNTAAVTDGNIAHNTYTTAPSGSWQYIQVDLGSERKDIEWLRTFHYWADGRAYNHRLEVSKDGINWVELYNSEVSGAYAESNKGRAYIINASYTTEAFSEIKQTTNTINLEVAKKTDKNSIISSINMTPENIKIAAAKLTLDGLVNFNNLRDGTTVISGANIKTGTINAIDIQGCDIRGTRNLYMAAGGTMACDGNTYIRNLFIPETHPAWVGKGSFEVAPSAHFHKEIHVGNEIYAREMGVIGRTNGVFIRIDNIGVQSGSPNNYLLINGYQSPHSFGVDLWYSDAKLKENIIPLKAKPSSNKITGLELIKNIEHYTYNYKESAGLGTAKVDCGYIAQQLKKVNPKLVREVKQQDDTVNLEPIISSIIPNLSLAIQQQQAQIDYLLNKVDALSAKNIELDKKFNNIVYQTGLD